jgi:hypothetical protein
MPRQGMDKTLAHVEQLLCQVSDRLKAATIVPGRKGSRNAASQVSITFLTKQAKSPKAHVKDVPIWICQFGSMLCTCMPTEDDSVCGNVQSRFYRSPLSFPRKQGRPKSVADLSASRASAKSGRV